MVIINYLDMLVPAAVFAASVALIRIWRTNKEQKNESTNWIKIFISPASKSLLLLWTIAPISMNMQTSQLTQLWSAVWFWLDSFQWYIQYLRLFLLFFVQIYNIRFHHELVVCGVCPCPCLYPWSCMCAVLVSLCILALEQYLYTNFPWMEHGTKTNQTKWHRQWVNRTKWKCVNFLVLLLKWVDLLRLFVNYRFKCESREKSEFTQNWPSSYFCLSQVFLLQLIRSLLSWTFRKIDWWRIISGPHRPDFTIKVNKIE